MRTMLIALCVGAVLGPLAAGAQQQQQISEYGYSYFAPPENVGTVTTIVGRLEPPVGFTYPFSVNFSTYEYTFYLQTTITAIDAGPWSTDYYYSNAEVTIYEDPAKNANYGINPPNVTSPSTFSNGTIALRGTLSNMVRSDDAFGFFDPTLIADCIFISGTKFPELAQGAGWTMHGGLVLNDPTTPTGYRHSWVMKTFFTGAVSTETSTWGGIKALYMIE